MKRFDYNLEVEHLPGRPFGLVNMTNVAASSVGGRSWTMG